MSAIGLKFKAIEWIFLNILHYVIGKSDSIIYALLLFIIMDYITGILLAIKTKCLSSAIGFYGIEKKFLIMIMVAMGNILDKYILHTQSVLRTIIILFYIANEGISILENIGMLGLKIPSKLRETLQKLKEENL